MRIPSFDLANRDASRDSLKYERNVMKGHGRLSKNVHNLIAGFAQQNQPMSSQANRGPQRARSWLAAVEKRGICFWLWP